MKITFIQLAGALALSAGGCLVYEAPADRPPPGSADVPAAAAAPADSIQVWLEAPAEATHGQPLLLVLNVRNALERPVTLRLTGQPTTYDFVVARPNGARVWSRMHDQIVLDILVPVTLAAGETRQFAHTWNLQGNDGSPVLAGAYSVRGLLPAENRTFASEPRSVTIRP